MTAMTKEATVLPEDLFSSDRNSQLAGWPCDDDDEPATWVVFHTKPRAEKALARRLAADETPFYLPLYEKSYRQQRRTVRSLLPLFPGYLFARVNNEQRYAAFATNQVANCLPVDDQERFYCDLFRVHQLIESRLPISREERIQPGTPAEIIGGPLKGYRGKVVRRSSGMRLVVEVDFLQSGASVEVETIDIRII